jgi:hypothetical protein
LNGVADLIPGGMEKQRCILPRKLACPAGQNQAICLGELMLAIASGHVLDHHTALGAANPAHLVEEEDKEPPEGNKLKTPFRQPVVTRCRSATIGASCRRACAWPQGHLDAFVV